MEANDPLAPLTEIFRNYFLLNFCFFMLLQTAFLRAKISIEDLSLGISSYPVVIKLLYEVM